MAVQWARFRISYELLLEIMRAVTHLPIDSEVVMVTLAPNNRLLELLLRSSEFDSVPEGEVPPLVRLEAIHGGGPLANSKSEIARKGVRPVAQSQMKGKKRGGKGGGKTGKGY